MQVPSRLQTSSLCFLPQPAACPQTPAHLGTRVSSSPSCLAALPLPLHQEYRKLPQPTTSTQEQKAAAVAVSLVPLSFPGNAQTPLVQCFSFPCAGL